MMPPRSGNHRPGSAQRREGVPVVVLLVLAGAAYGAWALGSRAGLLGGAGSSGLAPSSARAADVFGAFSSNYALHRAAAAVFLEHNVTHTPTLGICQEGLPMLEGVPDRVCTSLHCLWSEAAGANVDVWLQPLRELPTSAVEGRCPAPAGGQGPLPVGQTPVISFIVTMHDNAEVTAQCLLELLRTAHEVDSAEIVLVDDGSTEDVGMALETITRMQRLFGTEIVYLKNEKALGYGPANTKGIEAARGQFVALINNDMFVVRGWLTALLETFRIRPKAGMVGPLMMGRGNIVQEAGGLVYADASAANYGRGQPLNHWLNYLRVTDYISAACVVFRKELFVQLGGFDARYEKGYYEDTDLALSVASAGYEVLFQPLAVVYHQEGTTFGTDEESPLKRELMAKNKEKFLGKWRATLQDTHCPSQLGLRAAATRVASPKLLWVDDIVPEPDRDSGSIRAMNLLRILLDEGYHVTFAPTAPRDPRYSAVNRLHGVHVVNAANPLRWDEQDFLLPGDCAYDAILVARRAIYEKARDMLTARCPGVPIIYDTVDLHFLRESRDVISSLAAQQAMAAGSKDGASASWDFDRVGTQQVVEWLDSGAPETAGVVEKREVELELIDNSQAIVVVSEDEIEVIHHYRPNATVLVISNIHEVPQQTPTSCAGRSGLLFIGNMNHLPNCQAIQALLQQVLPHLKEQLPAEHRKDFMIHIVGANVVPPDLKGVIEEHKDLVTFHGYLPDDELYILYRRVRVVVAPLLSGAGVKGKVNQAMKQGVPIVSTPLGVEGMHVRDGVDGLVARSPAEFARKVVAAYTDCKLWQRLALGGYQNIRQHFSIEAARPAVVETLSHVGAAPHRGDAHHKCHRVRVPQLTTKQQAAQRAAAALVLAQQQALLLEKLQKINLLSPNASAAEVAKVVGEEREMILFAAQMASQQVVASLLEHPRSVAELTAAATKVPLVPAAGAAAAVSRTGTVVADAEQTVSASATTQAAGTTQQQQQAAGGAAVTTQVAGTAMKQEQQPVQTLATTQAASAAVQQQPQMEAATAGHQQPQTLVAIVQPQQTQQAESAAVVQQT